MIGGICFIVLGIRMVQATFLYPGVEVPHAVVIMSGNKFKCQGINWDGKIILTAGHCVEPNVTYTILAGFTDENGMMKKYLHKSTSEYVYRFEKYDHRMMDHDMAIILIKDIIRTTYVTSPINPRKYVSPDLKQCFLILWDLRNSEQLAYPVSIRLRPGMCLNSTIFPGVSVCGRKFCGEADLCIPDVSGASLNCDRETIGMAIKSKCIDSNSRSEVLFINLDNASKEIETNQLALYRNITNSAMYVIPIRNETYRRRSFDDDKVKPDNIERKLKSDCAYHRGITNSLFLLYCIHFISFVMH